MSKFKVGDKVTAYGTNIKGKIVCVDAYGRYPVIVSWEDGDVFAYDKNSDNLIPYKEPLVVWVNEYIDGFGAAFVNEAKARDFGRAGRAIRTIKFVEVIE